MPDAAYWAVARVQSQREAFAAEQLQARGFEVFLPKIETRRSVAPLFVGYVFVFIVGGHWLAIDRTFGVCSTIKFGDCPARVPDAEIAAIRARANERGIIELPPEPPKHVFRKGDRVKVLMGGCAFDGIHTGHSLRDRQRILLQVLGSVRPVMVASHLVHVAG
jgi:transcription antitermination factor NusG